MILIFSRCHKTWSMMKNVFKTVNFLEPIWKSRWCNFLKKYCFFLKKNMSPFNFFIYYWFYFFVNNFEQNYLLFTRYFFMLVFFFYNSWYPDQLTRTMINFWIYWTSCKSNKQIKHHGDNKYTHKDSNLNGQDASLCIYYIFLCLCTSL